jgi:hypothetical protein
MRPRRAFAVRSVFRSWSKRERTGLLLSDLYLGFLGITRGYLLSLLVLFLLRSGKIPSACGSVADLTRYGNRLVDSHSVDFQINYIIIKYNK